jgi:hypothetical protein
MEDLWHSRGGHLSPEARKVHVQAARGVRLHGTPRFTVSTARSCMPSRSSQDDRGSERLARIGLFDMPKGRLLVIKEDYSGKILPERHH